MTPVYGLKRQYTKNLPVLPQLSAKLTNLLQQKIGSILYYARAIETPALSALTELSQVHAKPTAHT